MRKPVRRDEANAWVLHVVSPCAETLASLGRCRLSASVPAHLENGLVRHIPYLDTHSIGAVGACAKGYSLSSCRWLD